MAGLSFHANARFLARQLRLGDRRTVFFIGAGVSVPCGLPLGDSLRDKLLTELFPEKPTWEQDAAFRASFYPDYPQDQETTLEMVMQQLAERMGREGMRDFLKPVFAKPAEPSLSHNLVASMAKKRLVSLCVTTNFDDLLEKALRSRGVGFTIVSGRDDWVSIDELPEEGAVVWKIHGDLGDPRSLAATKQDVLHFPDQKRHALYRLLRDNVIVFVGYSMRDPDIMEVVDALDPRGKEYTFFWVDPAPIAETSMNVQKVIERFALAKNHTEMPADDLFNELNYFLQLTPPAIIWRADEAMVVAGGVRGKDDPWNRDCPDHTRIFGAAPSQENYADWEGATIRLQADLPAPLRRETGFRKGAVLRVEVPPIDGKGVHGAHGARVILYLVTGHDKIKLAELACVRKGYFETYWPHDDRYRGVWPEFDIDSKALPHFDGLERVTLELEIEPRVCMDASRFILYFF